MNNLKELHLNAVSNVFIFPIWGLKIKQSQKNYIFGNNIFFFDHRELDKVSVNHKSGVERAGLKDPRRKSGNCLAAVIIDYDLYRIDDQQKRDHKIQELEIKAYEELAEAVCLINLNLLPRSNFRNTIATAWDIHDARSIRGFSFTSDKYVSRGSMISNPALFHSVPIDFILTRKLLIKYCNDGFLGNTYDKFYSDSYAEINSSIKIAMTQIHIPQAHTQIIGINTALEILFRNGSSDKDFRNRIDIIINKYQRKPQLYNKIIDYRNQYLHHGKIIEGVNAYNSLNLYYTALKLYLVLSGNGYKKHEINDLIIVYKKLNSSNLKFNIKHNNLLPSSKKVRLDYFLMFIIFDYNNPSEIVDSIYRMVKYFTENTNMDRRYTYSFISKIISIPKEISTFKKFISHKDIESIELGSSYSLKEYHKYFGIE